MNLPPCPCDLCANWIAATDPCAWREIPRPYGPPERKAVCIDCAGGWNDKPDRAPLAALTTPDA